MKAFRRASHLISCVENRYEMATTLRGGLDLQTCCFVEASALSCA